MIYLVYADCQADWGPPVIVIRLTIIDLQQEVLPKVRQKMV